MEPKWLTIARADLGEAEISGPACNPRIQAMFAAAKIADWAKDDSTVPWCGAALSLWMQEAGFEPPKGSARARAWSVWGEKLDEPRLGCVVVLQRGTDPNAGHVGLWCGEKDGRIQLLGGNQGDCVSITGYRREHVLAYRWPPGAPLVEIEAAHLTQSRIVTAGDALKAAGGFVAATGAVSQAVPTDWTAQVTKIGEHSAALKTTGEAVRDLSVFAASHWLLLLAFTGLGLAILGHKLKVWRVETARRVPYIGRG